jgi:hypothetical protein
LFAKITTGDRMGGLMSYLAGEGRANEHTDPHLVAGDATVMAWHFDSQLTHESALDLAHHLDRPRRNFERSAQAGGVATKTKPHVWHCSLSLRSEEGQLRDEEWQKIAETFVARMGFDDHEGTKAPTRWAAVRHGLSAGTVDETTGQMGDRNDHIHIVVNLVREDGTRAVRHNDFVRARDLCRELEKEFGLLPLDPNSYEVARSHARATWEEKRRDERDAGADPRIPWAELDDDQHRVLVSEEFATPEEFERAWSTRDKHAETIVSAGQYQYGEQEQAARRKARGRFEADRKAGRETRDWRFLPKAERESLINAAMVAEQPRWAMARTVRACAGASSDEAEFVRRMRQHGLVVRPRFAKGRTDIVEGYSVAVRPESGESPIWYGGNTLGRDLALPRLRSEWPSTPQTADTAVAEWSAGGAGRAAVAPGRETQSPDPAMWQDAVAQIAELRKQLPHVPLDDHGAWAKVARETAAAFAAWSKATEQTPGPFAAAADTLARSAQTTKPIQPKTALPSVAGTAYLLMAASKGGPAAQMAMLRQLISLGKAVHDMHAATSAAKRATNIEQTIRGQLAAVDARLAAASTPAAASAASRGPSGPGATPAQPAQRPTAAPGRPRNGPGEPGRPDRGIER